MASHVGTLMGLAGAGVWGYFNFVKSRTYHPRLEMSVTGEVRWMDDRKFLVPRVTLTNIGKSKIELLQSGSGYRVWTATGEFDKNNVAEWSGGELVFGMFEDHKWIEPGEMIFDELRLFAFTPDAVAAKIQARLVVPLGWLTRKNAEWNCSAIVGPVAPSKEKV